MASNMTSHTTNIQSWFIPVDIMMIVSTVVIILLGLMLLTIVIINRTYRTVPIMLVCNSCIVGIFFGFIMLSMSIFTLQNDMKQIIFEDSFCVFRGYLDYLAAALQNHSFALQAIHRYILVVHPSCISWQTARFQACLIGVKWIFLIISLLPLLLTDQIIYNAENQICQIPLSLSIPIIYVTLLIFLVPMTVIIFIYFKLLRYVNAMSKRITPTKTLFHARRQLKIVRRIFIIINGLLLLGSPYTAFIFMSFITTLPTYHFRIIFIFVYISSVFVMIALYYCTESINQAVHRMISMLRPNRE